MLCNAVKVTLFTEGNKKDIPWQGMRTLLISREYLTKEMCPEDEVNPHFPQDGDKEGIFKADFPTRSGNVDVVDGHTLVQGKVPLRGREAPGRRHSVELGVAPQ